MKRILAIIAILFITITILPTQAFANEDIKVTVTTKDNKQISNEQWDRIEVIIDNQSSSDFTGKVVANYSSTIEQEIFVEKNKQITVEFYIPPSMLEHYSDVDIQVRNSRNSIIHSQRLGMQWNSNRGDIGVVSNRPERFLRIAGLEGEITELKPSYLNNYQFLDHFNVIVIDDLFGFGLNQAQKNNLALWIQRGGMLVIGGGRNATQNTSIINSQMLPLIPNRNVEKDINISELTNLFQITSTSLVTEGEVKGEILLGTSDLPILVSKDAGKGNVIFSTLGLQDDLFDNTTNFERFWQQVLLSKNQAPASGNAFRLGQLKGILGWINLDLNTVSFLKPSFLIMGLMIYIMVIGPVNFIALKKLKKWDLGWVTVPVISIIFTLALFGLGNMGRSKELMNKQVNLIEYIGQQSVHIDSYNSIFVPSRSGNRVTLDSSNVSPISSGISWVNNTHLDISSARVWSNPRFLATAVKEQKVPTIEVDLYQSRTVLRVTNHLDYEFFESFLNVGGRWYKLGELKAGETKEYTLTNPTHIDYQFIFDRYGININWSHSQLMDTLVNNNITYVAFDDVNVPVNVRESKSTTALNVNVVHENLMKVDYKQSSAVSNVQGNITRVNYRQFQRWDRSVYVEEEGDLEVMFSLPKGVDYTGAQFVLQFGLYKYGSNIDLSIYHNESGEWVSHTYSDKVTVPNLEEYLINNKVFIKLATTDGSMHIESHSFNMSVVGGSN